MNACNVSQCIIAAQLFLIFCNLKMGTSSNLTKPSNNYSWFILKHFGLFLIEFQS